MSDPTRPDLPLGAGGVSDRVNHEQRVADIESLEKNLTRLQLGNPEDILLWNPQSGRSLLQRMRSSMRARQGSNTYSPSKRFDELTWWAAWLTGARSILLLSALIVLLLILCFLPTGFYQDLLNLGEAASYARIHAASIVASSAQQPSPQAVVASKVISIGLRVLGIYVLIVAIVTGALSSVSNAVETGCLFRIGEFFLSGSRRNPSLMRSVIRRGTLRYLLRDLFDHLYPLGEPTAEHLRRIAEQIYAENDKKVPDFAVDHPAGDWLHWIRTVESRLLLRLLAVDPSLGYLLDDELERRKWWLRIIPIFTAHRPTNESRSTASINSGWGNSNIVVLVLASMLLPLLGGYLNSSFVSHNQSDENKILLDRVLQGVPHGASGYPGRDGRDGKDGKDGLTGMNGKDGVPGRNGMPGKDGMDGKEGAPGKDGKNSAPGFDGACCKEQDGGNVGSEVVPVGAKGTQSEEGGDVLVPFTPGQETANVTIDFYKSTSSSKPIALTLQNSENLSWPPDPVVLVGKKPDGTSGNVSVSARRTYNAFLNSDVWIEESLSKKWYQLGHGKNLLVVHIHPHPIDVEVKGTPIDADLPRRTP